MGYQESWESLLRPAITSSKKSGYTHVRKELASWVRMQRRRVIRREELLNFLAGMTYQSDTNEAILGASTGGAAPEPLLGVEEILQAATLENPDIFRPIAGVKRRHLASSSSSPSSTVVSSTPSPTKSQLDHDMADLLAPAVKKPRKS